MSGFNAPAFVAAVNLARVAAGVTWAEVAAQTSVHKTTLSRMSQNKRLPNAADAACLAKWAGVDLSDFAEIEGAQEEPGRKAQALAGVFKTAIDICGPSYPGLREATIRALGEQPSTGREYRDSVVQAFEHAVSSNTQWHTLYQGKCMPKDVEERFFYGRDVIIPELRRRLLAGLKETV